MATTEAGARAIIRSGVIPRLDGRQLFPPLTGVWSSARKGSIAQGGRHGIVAAIGDPAGLIDSGNGHGKTKHCLGSAQTQGLPPHNIAVEHIGKVTDDMTAKTMAIRAVL